MTMSSREAEDNVKKKKKVFEKVIRKKKKIRKIEKEN